MEISGEDKADQQQSRTINENDQVKFFLIID